MPVDHALINYGEGCARVRTYAQGIRTDDYTVHYADADPVATLPNGISITKVNDR